MIWNYQSGDSITSLGSHDSYIYSLTSLPTVGGGGLASAGEDGIVKLWNEDDGELDQEILVPALSGDFPRDMYRCGNSFGADRVLRAVWSVTALPNGDIACACSDNLIWVFTRDATRCADQATITEYEDKLELHR